jgi:ABC-type multidrug transport system fused ATPase/permease subunit
MMRLENSRVYACLLVLGKKERQKIILMTLAQIIVNLLDLFGVAIVGLLGALTVNGIKSQQPSSRITQILEFAHLNTFSFQLQVAILGLVVVFSMMLRTLLSIYFARKTLFFLAHQSAQISSILISKLLAQDLLKVNKRTTQENLYSVTAGVNIVVLGVIGSGVLLIADISLLLFMLFGLFVVDPIVALTTLALFGTIAYGLYRFMHTRAAKIAAHQMDLTIKSSGSLLDALNSYRELVVLNRRSYVSGQIAIQRNLLANMTAELQFMPNLSKHIIESTVILSAMIISAIQFLVQDSTQAISTLAVFLAAGSRIAPAVLRLQQSAVQIRSSIASSSSTLDMFLELEFVKPLPKDKSEFDRNYEGFNPVILLENVNFSYPGSNRTLIKNLNLEIEAGDFVAIVGPSGEGKSTIVDLLLGIIKPSSGRVTISNLDPIDTYAKWPGAVAYVPQSVFLFDGTVKDNLCLGYNSELIDEADFRQVLRETKLDFFFENNNHGILTEVGEAGAKLSGGQRQRLGIARALISRPKLLIMDEVTSALDSETEASLAESLMSLKGSSTIVMIAHRLSSVRLADSVVYVQDGQIRAIGTFSEVRSQIAEFDEQARLMGL